MFPLIWFNISKIFFKNLKKMLNIYIYFEGLWRGRRNILKSLFKKKKKSTVKQKGDYDDFQAPKPDPREMPPLRPLESDADVSVHNFSIWVLTVTRPAQTEIIC